MSVSSNQVLRPRGIEFSQLPIRHVRSLTRVSGIDPVSAEVIRSAMETVCFEAATHLGRAASSPIINSSNERNASIIDAHGRLAAVAFRVRLEAWPTTRTPLAFCCL